MKYFKCSEGIIELPVALANFSSALLMLIKIIVPIILIGLGIIDMVKSMTEGDEDKIAKARNLFVKRLISGALVFFVVTITNFIFDLVGNSSSATAYINSFINGVDDAKCEVYVKENEKKLILNTLNAKLDLNNNKTYEIKVSYDSKNISPNDIKFTSLDTSIATVENGMITAVSEGSTEIILEYNNMTTRMTVNVGNKPVVKKKPEYVRFSDKQEYNGAEYYLYLPPELKTGKMTDIPVIVYLHGGAGKGKDQSGGGDLVNSYIKKGYEFPGIIIIPSYNLSTDGIKKIKEDAVMLADMIVETYGANKDRVSITGFSTGGMTAWEVARANPTYFSCIVTVAGSPGSNNIDFYSRDKFTTTPTLVIGFNDGVSDYKGKGLYNANKKAGGKIKYIGRNEGHGKAIKVAYINLKIMDWMVKQNRTNDLSSVVFP